jgi:ABC-type transporter Mla subunit MlaD
MTSNKKSLQEKKLYLKQMSQHFKEMADKQTNQTQRVIANTFSKNADIMEDLYSQIEELSTELTNTKSEIQYLLSNMSVQLSEIKQNTEKGEEKSEES